MLFGLHMLQGRGILLTQNFIGFLTNLSALSKGCRAEERRSALISLLSQQDTMQHKTKCWICAETLHFSNYQNNKWSCDSPFKTDAGNSVKSIVFFTTTAL